MYKDTKWAVCVKRTLALYVMSACWMGRLKGGADCPTFCLRKMWHYIKIYGILMIKMGKINMRIETQNIFLVYLLTVELK